MDRTVNPGRRLRPLRERRMGAQDADPGRPGVHRRRLRRLQPVAGADSRHHRERAAHEPARRDVSSFMNEAAVETLDDKPLQADLKRVAAIDDKDAFARFMGADQRRDSASRSSAPASRPIRRSRRSTSCCSARPGSGSARSRLLPDRHVQAAARRVSRLHRADVHDGRLSRARRRRPMR